MVEICAVCVCACLCARARARVCVCVCVCVKCPNETLIISCYAVKKKD